MNVFFIIGGREPVERYCCDIGFRNKSKRTFVLWIPMDMILTLMPASDFRGKKWLHRRQQMAL